MSLGSKYIGMCKPVDPDDNYHVGEHQTVLSPGYLVPSGDYIGYSPILTIPVSKRHALVVERNGRSLRLYKINVNDGVYDPAVEECGANQRNFNPVNVWVNDFVFYIKYENSIVEGYSPDENRVLLVARDPLPYITGVDGEDFLRWGMSTPDWGDRYSGNRSLRMDYHLYYFSVPHYDDISLLWHRVFADNIIFPEYMRGDGEGNYEPVYGWGPAITFEWSGDWNGSDYGVTANHATYPVADALRTALYAYYDSQFVDRDETHISNDFAYDSVFPMWTNEPWDNPGNTPIPGFLMDSIGDWGTVIHDALYGGYYWQYYPNPVPPEVLGDIASWTANAVAWSTAHNLTFYVYWYNWKRRAWRGSLTEGSFYVIPDPGYTGRTSITEEGVREEHSVITLLQGDSTGGTPL